MSIIKRIYDTKYMTNIGRIVTLVKEVSVVRYD
jgi:hypothetical protein